MCKFNVYVYVCVYVYMHMYICSFTGAFIGLFIYNMCIYIYIYISTIYLYTHLNIQSGISCKHRSRCVHAYLPWQRFCLNMGQGTEPARM